MERTRYKYLVLLILMAVISSVAHAEKGDNTAPPSAEQKPAVLNTTSYFQGTWAGNWESETRGGSGREITITVGPKNPDKTFDIEYSWGFGTNVRGAPIAPGTVKAKGKEDGEKLEFEFTDPLNLKTSSIVMTKYQDDRAKAQIAYGSRKLVAYLRRK